MPSPTDRTVPTSATSMAFSYPSSCFFRISVISSALICIVRPPLVPSSVVETARPRGGPKRRRSRFRPSPRSRPGSFHPPRDRSAPSARHGGRAPRRSAGPLPPRPGRRPRPAPRRRRSARRTGSAPPTGSPGGGGSSPARVPGLKNARRRNPLPPFRRGRRGPSSSRRAARPAKRRTPGAGAPPTLPAPPRAPSRGNARRRSRPAPRRGRPAHSCGRKRSPAPREAADGFLEEALAVFRRDLGGQPLHRRRGGQIGGRPAQLLGGEREAPGDLLLRFAAHPLGLLVRPLDEHGLRRLPFRQAAGAHLGEISVELGHPLVDLGLQAGGFLAALPGFPNPLLDRLLTAAKGPGERARDEISEEPEEPDEVG